ncbi:hypothetical protein N8567_02090, partial [Akkermansiaceae bacterium]|nr:hypothetical protein [Akkermansiaceae bacterium]
LVLIIQHFSGGFDGAQPVDILFNVISIGTSTGYVSSDFIDGGGGMFRFNSWGLKSEPDYHVGAIFEVWSTSYLSP